MITVYGSSDDLFEIDDDSGDSYELNCYDKAAWVRIGSSEGGLLVIGDYAPGATACWRMSVEPLDEDVPCPWPVRIEFKGYSPRVIVDCPAGTKYKSGLGVPDLETARAERKEAEIQKRMEDARKAAEAQERAELVRRAVRHQFEGAARAVQALDEAVRAVRMAKEWT